MPIIVEEEEEPTIITLGSIEHLPKRKVNGKLIGSKRNHASHISRKRIQTMFNVQKAKDKLLDIRKNINQIIDEGCNNYNNLPPPAASTLVIF